MSHATSKIVSLVAVVVLSTWGARDARANWFPVSRTLHARATAGTSSHLPPDLEAGQQFVQRTHSASISDPMTGASAMATVTSQLRSSGIDPGTRVDISGSLSTTIGVPRGAVANMTLVFDVGTPQTWELQHYTLAPRYFGEATLREVNSGLVLFTGPPQDLTMGGVPITTPFNLTPGRYELFMQGEPRLQAGTGGSAMGTLIFTGPPIPEPASVAALLATFAFAAARPRRSRRRATGDGGSRHE